MTSSAQETPVATPSWRELSREGLENLDQTLAVLERAAWDVRAMADRAVEVWASLEHDGRRAKRASAVGWMLTKVLADYRLFAIYSAFLSERKRAAVLDRLHAKNARRFRETAAAQGGGFVKVGQMLSARPDLLPASWIGELASLQDALPAEPWDSVRTVIEADLGRPLAELFRSIDEQPLAAASIGQVHRAVTLDGREVAVKVQRPSVPHMLDVDLSLMEVFLDGMRGILPPSDYGTITREVRDAVSAELDYRKEAESMTQMATLFEAAAGVVVPRVVCELSGARVLTSTFVAGEKLTSALDRLAAAGDQAQVSELLGRLLEAYLAQILVHGFYQADPHPGNFLVTPAGELALLDFGCVRALPPAGRAGYLALVQAFVTRDRARVATLLGELGFATESGKPDTLEVFASGLLDRFADAAAAGAFQWPTRDEMMSETAAMLSAAKTDPVIRIPADFVMIGRVFGTLGGLFLHYRPELDYARRVIPHLARAMMAAQAASSSIAA